jgi:hypothetical protein
MRRRATLLSWLLRPALPERDNAPGYECPLAPEAGASTQTPGTASFLRDMSRMTMARSPTPLTASETFTAGLSLAERGRFHLHELVLGAHRVHNSRAIPCQCQFQ